MYSYGARIDDDSNAITVIDEENVTAVTTGYVNGEYVEFSGGGGSSDFSTATVTIIPTSIGQIGFLGEDFDVSNMVRGLIEDDIGNFYLSKNFKFESLTTQEIAVLLPADGWIFASFGSEPTITGNATKDYDGYEWSVTITGDCTITGALNPIA